MSYTKNLKLKQRRHPTQHLTPEQAIAKANSIVDEANAHIARLVGEIQHIEAAAKEELERAYGEMETLREENGELKAMIARLEEENRRLRKRARKGKGERLEPDDYNDLG